MILYGISDPDEYSTEREFTLTDENTLSSTVLQKFLSK